MFNGKSLSQIMDSHRREAANTLVVPYDADINTVNQAYETRLVQRMELDEDDPEIFINALKKLHRAKTIMSYSPRYQFLAYVKLATTNRTDVMTSMYQTYLINLLNDEEFDDPDVHQAIDFINTEFNKIDIKNKLYKACIATNIGIAASMAIKSMTINGLPVSMAMVGGGVALGIFATGKIMQRSMRRNQNNISLLLNAAADENSR